MSRQPCRPARSPIMKRPCSATSRRPRDDHPHSRIPADRPVGRTLVRVRASAAAIARRTSPRRAVVPARKASQAWRAPVFTGSRRGGRIHGGRAGWWPRSGGTSSPGRALGGRSASTPGERKTISALVMGEGADDHMRSREARVGHVASERFRVRACRSAGRGPSPLEVVARRRAATVESVAQVAEDVGEPLGFFRTGCSDRCAGRYMFSRLVQGDVKVFGRRAIQPQHDVARHADSLRGREWYPAERSGADMPRRERQGMPHQRPRHYCGR